MDRKRAQHAFEEYVRAYDPSNPRISLKIAHTLRVAQLCDTIAREVGLDADLAWLCGLLHDIGRFEQVRRYDTFNDSRSVSHAALGVEVLFGSESARLDENHVTPLIRSFISEESHDELLRTAIAHHSDYQLPSCIGPTTRAFCDLLRDADKIDIIKVNCICPIEDIYGVSSLDMARSELSNDVVRIFYQHRTIPRDLRNYPADVLVSHICFTWELVYPASRRILIEQQYLEQMLSRHFLLPHVQQEFEHMASHLRTWLATTDRHIDDRTAPRATDTHGEEPSMNERLSHQLAFALELDKEKNVLRQTHLSGHGRRENDAEHAWHMAVMAWLLREYANEEIDIARTMLMCLIHDVVEIDAGDTYAYDSEGLETQQAREEAAKQRVFGLLPDDQAQQLMELFEEFEAYETPEAKFAHTMDNLQPITLNASNGGSDWREHGVTAEQVYGRQRKSALGSTLLYEEAIEPIIEHHIEHGNIRA